MRIKLDEVSKAVALKMKLKEFTVKEINRCQWKMLFDIIYNDKQEPVKIMYIGKFTKSFRGSDKQKEHLERRKKQKELNESSRENISGI